MKAPLTDHDLGLAGQWAVVTGAATGIGAALARGFAGLGMNIVIADIRVEQARATADALAEMGVQTRAEGVDVTERDTLMALANRLSDEGIDPTLVWANAGVGVGATLLEGSARTIEWAVSANILSIAWTLQAFGKGLIGRAGVRHFGVTASTASITDVTGPFPLYAATKQGTAAFGEAVRAELEPHGVAVTILYPGLVNTEIWNGGQARPERFGGAKVMPHEVGATWRAAPGPDVLVGPVLETMAAGGGRCVVDVAGDAKPLSAQRAAAIADAFKPPHSTLPTRS